MKKMFFIVGFILLYITATFAQLQEIPIDPKVRYGKLENGLTYYIRHNELPKQRADFYIAQNVGSILEEDNQNGLAHFLEHMAFNGSTHFPGNSLIDYLETIGVKFGYNLNAFTDVDRTVYNISNVPTTREGIIDSCLLILHDWSGSLLLDEKEINKERGVIREEMRTYTNAGQRMREAILKQIMPENRYAQRNIIGTEEVIMNFKPEAIRAYYKKWYRPDLQALIIIGDFDAEQVENKLKTLFADIPAPVNPAERVYFKVEDNAEPLVGIVTDKEATSSRVTIHFKHEPLPREQKSTIICLLYGYFNSIISGVMNNRITELAQQANPPFVAAGVGNGKFENTATKESLYGISVIKGNEYELGLKAITRELERINRYGFTASEYDRARADILAHFENIAKEVDKRQNSGYANEYVQHFTEGGYIPGFVMENELMKGVAGQIPVAMVNQYVQELISDSNIVITLTAPEKEGVVIPKKEDLLKWFNEVRKEDIQAYEDKVSGEALLTDLPKGGSVVSEKKDAIFDAAVLTLSNGVKVVVKPTKLKDDQIIMTASSPGGSSLFPDSEIVNANLYSNIANLGGLANFSQLDLSKVLAGKNVSVSPNIDLQYEGLSGNSTIKDFETMLQLVYLNFTAPRTDEDTYNSFIARIKSQLESQELNPEISMNDSLMKEIYVDQIRHKRIKAVDLDKVNYQTIMNWRKDRYADAGDFTFVFTGNIDIETAKPLFAQYLGGLPSINRKESFRAVNENFKSGIKANEFEKKMENPKSIVFDLYWTNFEPTLKNRLEINILQQILTTIYLEEIREKEGGVYSIQATSNISDYPKGQTPFQIVFETEPGKEGYLNDIAIKEFQNIVDNGPKAEYFNKVKEYLLKTQQDREQENSYWSSTISNYYRTGYNAYTDYVKTINTITPADIQKKAKSIIDAKNFTKVIMKGVKE
ncbi:peptidase M16 [Bacteroidia bacterium]|nr:peptidase M16 [Bacteroidia bacterium]